ncbi:hypothetical protein WJX72_007753 [[Myrmecia] bisecta]|uniref:BZIP domain-containing protein n=1 Tax=[Myrmecia] bisecta TaxID=41462 RepID=A0AAW1QRJ7_9CHLO
MTSQQEQHGALNGQQAAPNPQWSQHLANLGAQLAAGGQVSPDVGAGMAMIQQYWAQHYLMQQQRLQGGSQNPAASTPLTAEGLLAAMASDASLTAQLTQALPHALTGLVPKPVHGVLPPDAAIELKPEAAGPSSAKATRGAGKREGGRGTTRKPEKAEEGAAAQANADLHSNLATLAASVARIPASANDMDEGGEGSPHSGDSSCPDQPGGACHQQQYKPQQLPDQPDCVLQVPGGPVVRCAKEKNRQAQRRFRERQKGLIAALRERADSAAKQAEDAARTINDQARTITALEKENQMLKMLLQDRQAHQAVAPLPRQEPPPPASAPMAE